MITNNIKILTLILLFNHAEGNAVDNSSSEVIEYYHISKQQEKYQRGLKEEEEKPSISICSFSPIHLNRLFFDDVGNLNSTHANEAEKRIDYR